MAKNIQSSFSVGIILLVGFLAYPPSTAQDFPLEDSVILLKVESTGVLSVRDLTFTNTETGAEVWIRDLMGLGRTGPEKYVMQDLPAGEYYLSAIHTMSNGNDSPRPIEPGKDDAVITLLPGTINYIGDFILESREFGAGIRSGFDFEANTATLMAAVVSKEETFRRMEVAITIPGNNPIPVDKKLLGL